LCCIQRWYVSNVSLYQNVVSYFKATQYDRYLIFIFTNEVTFSHQQCMYLKYKHKDPVICYIPQSSIMCLHIVWTVHTCNFVKVNHSNQKRTVFLYCFISEILKRFHSCSFRLRDGIKMCISHAKTQPVAFNSSNVTYGFKHSSICTNSVSAVKSYNQNYDKITCCNFNVWELVANVRRGR
jgi:hypothetical protein